MGDTTTTTDPKTRPISPEVQAKLHAARDWAAQNWRSATLARAAKVAGLSPHHFCRTFHRFYDKSFKRFVGELQIGHAQQLLLTKLPLAEVAERAGFCHQSSMTTRFRQITGTTPAAWRKQQAKE